MFERTRIKICGMTDVQEVKQAITAGVDAVGFIFVKKSPRYIEPNQAKEIINSIPPLVDAVGVFMDEAVEEVEEIIHYCGLSIAQLHGVETPEYCEKLPCKVIKTFQVGPHVDRDFVNSYEKTAAGYLFDTYHENMGGGTGKTFDWNRLYQIKPDKPFLLAGGLTPDNVGTAIRKVKPFAVDVNSGVELAPGRKDMNKIRHLIDEVIKADRGDNE